MNNYSKIYFIIILIIILFFLIKNKTKNSEFFTNNSKINYLYKNPDIILIKNFLTEKECNYIIKLGEPHIKRSEVCGNAGSSANKSRTSMTAHIGKKFVTKKHKDAILMNVMNKASKFCKKPFKNIEHIQLVRYFKGQFFKPHYDYLDRNIPYYNKNIKRNGQRQFTFFVYLSSCRR